MPPQLTDAQRGLFRAEMLRAFAMSTQRVSPRPTQEMLVSHIKNVENEAYISSATIDDYRKLLKQRCDKFTTSSKQLELKQQQQQLLEMQKQQQIQQQQQHLQQQPHQQLQQPHQQLQHSHQQLQQQQQLQLRQQQQQQLQLQQQQQLLQQKLQLQQQQQQQQQKLVQQKQQQQLQLQQQQQQKQHLQHQLQQKKQQLQQQQQQMLLKKPAQHTAQSNANDVYWRLLAELRADYLEVVQALKIQIEKSGQSNRHVDLIVQVLMQEHKLNAVPLRTMAQLQSIQAKLKANAARWKSTAAMSPGSGSLLATTPTPSGGTPLADSTPGIGTPSVLKTPGSQSQAQTMDAPAPSEVPVDSPSMGNAMEPVKPLSLMAVVSENHVEIPSDVMPWRQGGKEVTHFWWEKEQSRCNNDVEHEKSVLINETERTDSLIYILRRAVRAELLHAPTLLRCWENTVMSDEECIIVMCYIGNDNCCSSGDLPTISISVSSDYPQTSPEILSHGKSRDASPYLANFWGNLEDRMRFLLIPHSLSALLDVIEQSTLAVRPKNDIGSVRY